MSTRLDDRIKRGRVQHGDKFDPSALWNVSGQILNAYEQGLRIKVRTAYGEEATGTVSTTTGWRPCFILMRRSNAMGSSFTLGETDRVVAIKLNGRYTPV